MVSRVQPHNFFDMLKLVHKGITKYLAEKMQQKLDYDIQFSKSPNDCKFSNIDWTKQYMHGV